MPLYPYRCTKCGHKFEKIQSFSAEVEKVCPKCGGVLERPLTVPGFNFKGAGWYVNDYASKGNSGSSSSDSSSSNSSAGESKSSDSKAGDSGGKSSPAETKSPAKTETASAAAASASSTNS